jgi:hypothetical protein
MLFHQDAEFFMSARQAVSTFVEGIKTRGSTRSSPDIPARCGVRQVCYTRAWAKLVRNSMNIRPFHSIDLARKCAIPVSTEASYDIAFQTIR